MRIALLFLCVTLAGCLPGFVFDWNRSDAMDVLVSTDATMDSTVTVDVVRIDVQMDPSILAPRPISPLSTSTVTTQTPTFRWMLQGGADGAAVDICRDRQFSDQCQTLRVTNTSGHPDAALSPGVWFWRVRGRMGAVEGVNPGPTWEFIVGGRSAARDSSWGSILDLNGDGLADVATIVNGRTRTDGGVQLGRVSVFLGTRTGLAATPNQIMEGTSAAFPQSVQSAGDTNGDGYADLIATDGRNAYLFLGGSNGVVVGSPLVVTENGTVSSASSAGDINGDGFGDIILGGISPMANVGAAWVHLGSATGIPAAPTRTLMSPVAGTNPPMDGYGTAVTSPGDLNADGFSDIVIGAPTSQTIHVYYGNANTNLIDNPVVNPDTTSHMGGIVLSAGDVDGDGFVDLITGPSVFFYAMVVNPGGGVTCSWGAGTAYMYRGGIGGLVTTPSATFVSPDGPRSPYAQSIAADDLNGDGFSDILVTAGVGTLAVPAAYLFSGSATGTVLTAPGLLSPSSVGCSCGTCVPHVIRTGDINGDGHADLVIAAIDGTTSVSQLYVFDGTPTGISTSPSATITP